MPTRQQIAQFLKDFKAAVSLGHVHWLQRADESKSHLSGLRINMNQAVDCLAVLDVDNYVGGPTPDDFAPEREVWVFGCDVLGTEAYIKLALQPDNKRRTVVHALIWAFHAAEHPLRFPLRKTP
jgi:hypothetical protein